MGADMFERELSEGNFGFGTETGAVRAQDRRGKVATAMIGRAYENSSHVPIAEVT